MASKGSMTGVDLPLDRVRKGTLVGLTLQKNEHGLGKERKPVNNKINRKKKV